MPPTCWMGSYFWTEKWGCCEPISWSATFNNEKDFYWSGVEQWSSCGNEIGRTSSRKISFMGQKSEAKIQGIVLLDINMAWVESQDDGVPFITFGMSFALINIMDCTTSSTNWMLQNGSFGSTTSEIEKFLRQGDKRYNQFECGTSSRATERWWTVLNSLTLCHIEWIDRNCRHDHA